MINLRALNALRRDTQKWLYEWSLKFLQSDIFTPPVCESMAQLLSCGITYFSLFTEDGEILIDYSVEKNWLTITYDNDEEDFYILDEKLHTNLSTIVSERLDSMNNMVVEEYGSCSSSHFYMQPRYNVANMKVAKREQRRSHVRPRTRTHRR